MLPLLLVISPGQIAMALIYLLIIVIFLAVVYYIINKHAPEPLKGWAITIVVVLGAIALIYFLWALIEGGGNLKGLN